MAGCVIANCLSAQLNMLVLESLSSNVEVSRMALLIYE